MARPDCMTAAGVVCNGAADGRVEVEFAAPAQCKGCEGVCMWRRGPSVNRAVFATALPLVAGDQVVVAVPQRYVLLGSVLVHGLPLAAMLGGALIGVATTGTDIGCLTGAVIAVALVVIATPRLRRRIERTLLSQVVVARGRADRAP